MASHLITPMVIEDDPGELVEHMLVSFQQGDSMHAVKAQFRMAIVKMIDDRIKQTIAAAMVELSKK